MTFNDIFKSSFLEKVTQLSLLDSALALASAFLIGLFIYAVYKKTYTGVMYSRTFNISLIGMSLITALVIVGVTSNIVLSLGMVGALSIVRFRTAIKDPMDIVFLFWSISVGILCGAGLLPLAIVGSLLLGVLLVFMMNRTQRDNPYLLVVQCRDDAAEGRVYAALDAGQQKYTMKAKNITPGNVELTLEVRVKERQAAFVNTVSALEGVQGAALVSYDGNYGV